MSMICLPGRVTSWDRSILQAEFTDSLVAEGSLATGFRSMVSL